MTLRDMARSTVETVMLQHHLHLSKNPKSFHTLVNSVSDAVLELLASERLTCAGVMCGACARGDDPKRDGPIWYHGQGRDGLTASRSLLACKASAIRNLAQG